MAEELSQTDWKELKRRLARLSPKDFAALMGGHRRPITTLVDDPNITRADQLKQVAGIKRALLTTLRDRDEKGGV